MRGLLAKKLGMSRVFNSDGEVVPVTILNAGPCVVTQLKTIKNDGYEATLKLMKLKKDHIIRSGKHKIILKNIPVRHGRIDSIAYIVNNKCAYIPDANQIYAKDIKNFEKLEYLVIDCLQYNQHPSHFSLFDVLNLIKKIKPKKTILTNLNNQIDYLSVKKVIPKNVFPAYDGMSFYL